MADNPIDQDLYNSEGRTGFTDAMNEFMSMWNAGNSFVDIMLVLREHYPEDMIDTVLEDARSQGYI